MPTGSTLAAAGAPALYPNARPADFALPPLVGGPVHPPMPQCYAPTLAAYPLHACWLPVLTYLPVAQGMQISASCTYIQPEGVLGTQAQPTYENTPTFNPYYFTDVGRTGNFKLRFQWRAFMPRNAGMGDPLDLMFMTQDETPVGIVGPATAYPPLRTYRTDYPSDRLSLPTADQAPSGALVLCEFTRLPDTLASNIYLIGALVRLPLVGGAVNALWKCAAVSA